MYDHCHMTFLLLIIICKLYPAIDRNLRGIPVLMLQLMCTCLLVLLGSIRFSKTGFGLKPNPVLV